MMEVRHDQAKAFVEAPASMKRVREAGHGHVFSFWDKLTEGSQRQLLHQLSLIDFGLIEQIYREYIVHKKKPDISALEPAEIITLAHQHAHPEETAAMTARGEAMLRAGKIAAVLVAGGQASRLGFDKPKGEYPIGPVSKKSLFQLHAEKLLATARRHRTRIPWYIMTSDANAGETRAFFEQNNLFGYPPADIFFFEQEMMPALDENGKLILDAPDHIFMNPNGHGGTLTALKKSGALANMRRRGIDEIFYFQVDNVLLHICDPLFVGYHAAANAEMSAKVCAKRDPYEKVGVIGKVIEAIEIEKRRLKVIEYSDMSKADKEARHPDGTLKYNAGSIAIHLFKVSFIEREVAGGTKLPWHVAYKQIPYLDANGRLVQPEKSNGYKFETFIFDALGDAERVVLLEVDRRFDFSPVKNAAGEDSPQTAQRDMCELYASWLEQAGAKIPRDASGNLKVPIEVSPLFALDAEELARKVTPNLHIQTALYFEETEKSYDFGKAVDQARRFLANGDYLAARRQLCEIPKDQRERLKSEFAFVFDFEKSEDDDLRDWGKRSGQIEWRRKVWAALVAEEMGELKEDASASEINKKGTGKESAEQEDPEKEGVGVSPEQKGEALEKDTLKLLRHLFVFDNSDVVYLNKMRQQRRSAQFGCDIKLEYCRAIHNRHVRCLVECKSHEGELPFPEILEKLYDAKANQIGVDHWILIAPRALLVGNVPDGLVERWNITQEFPFTVQFWTKDTDISRFFGLEPDVYDRWIDHPKREMHPRQWTQEEKDHITKSWLRRLEPSLRLPQAWAKYVTDETENGLFIENDDRKSLSELWKRKQYLPPRVLDASRSPLPFPLQDTVRNWLNEDGVRVCLVLADFGDGKTAFTYMLARELLAEYRKNPLEGWLPVRFPLRRFARPNFNARDFLRDRLENFGATVSEWNTIVDQKNILVVLDGMDEMTKTLNADAVRTAVNLLADCCNHEFERVRKLLITCRTPFFEELTQRRYIEEKLGAPRIIYIERFDRRQVYDKLNNLAETDEQRLKLHAMRQMHDPLGLAGKGLFFKMVSENLTNPKSDFSSETAIYQTYIDNCLRSGKKTELLETNRQHTTEAELRTGLLEIMENIAMQIHLSAKDYVCLRKVEGTSHTLPLGAARYAQLLWQSVEEEQEQAEDALHRVGVRSLLHKKNQGVDTQDEDAWPVEFCHRSMREYFVARGIEKAVRQGVAAALEILSKVDFNHEILRFTAELMKKSEHDYQGTLRKLALLSRIDGDPDACQVEERQRCARLGRMSVTLLYKWQGKLPENDWSNLTLDGAQLSRANLTGKDFRNTSLRSANLNNAVFVEADFCGADMTGVRLEETGEVYSLSVPRNLDGFFAIYRDGSIRQWNLDGESRIIYEALEKLQKRDNAFQIAALPGDGLCLFDRQRVVFLNVAERRYEEAGVFETQRLYLNAIFKEAGMVVVEKVRGPGCLIRVFDFLSNCLPKIKDLAVDACVHCDLLGDKAVVVALEGGRLVVYFKGTSAQAAVAPQPIQVAEFANPSAIAAIGPVDAKQKTYLIACGGRNGVVGLWRWRFGDSPSDADYQEIFREPVHQGAVTTVCFMGAETLLTGGTDSKIYLLNVSDLKKAPSSKRVFELRLQCRGMKIEGLKGEHEREILESAIAAQ